jgi:hypothetical protein
MSSERCTGPDIAFLSPLDVLDDLSSGELIRVTEGPERCPGPYQPDMPNTSSNMFKVGSHRISFRRDEATGLHHLLSMDLFR